MRTLPDPRPLLIGVLNRPPDRGELKQFVLLCRSITQGLLLGYHQKSVRLLATHGWSVYDLSIDCLGELFAADAEGRLFKLEEFVEKLGSPVMDLSEIDVFLALKGYVNRFVIFRLKRLMAEADPEGRRVVRNIREFVRRKGSPLRIIEDVSGDFLELAQPRPDAGLPEIPPDVLESQLFASVNRAGSIPRVLQELAKTLARQRTYRKGARLSDVVQIVKKFYTHRFFMDGLTQAESESVSSGLLPEQFPDGLRESTLRHVAEKIDATYYRTRKLELDEARGLFRTMTAILDEWLAGEQPEDGYYDHVKTTLGCTKKEFDERWSARVHYLVKTMRQFLSTQLSS